MLHKTYKLHADGSQPYARLITYLLEDSPEMKAQDRPLVLICPGGGYSMTSDREAEPIALCLNAAGIHAAVLRYSVAPSVYPTALTEAALSVALIRKNAKKWHVDPSKIVVQGASAGAHLACSYALFYEEAFLKKATDLPGEALRPAGMMLSYPVITSGKYAHQGSFECLLGDTYEHLKTNPLLKKLSLEHQVTKNTPKAFLWHTWTDNCVPVENSLLIVNALRKNNIPTEFHLFPEGPHGLGLANDVTDYPGGGCIQEDCQIWIDLAVKWLKKL